jgi:hypothetical protein
MGHTFATYTEASISFNLSCGTAVTSARLHATQFITQPTTAYKLVYYPPPCRTPKNLSSPGRQKTRCPAGRLPNASVASTPPPSLFCSDFSGWRRPGNATIIMGRTRRGQRCRLRCTSCPNALMRGIVCKNWCCQLCRMFLTRWSLGCRSLGSEYFLWGIDIVFTCMVNNRTD